MAEFGAKLCSNPGCRQHDFLPFTCPACGRVFCLEHMAIGSGHDCEAGEAYLASRGGDGGSFSSTSSPIEMAGASQQSHTASVTKMSQAMSAVASRFDGREDELNADITHVNIKASKGQAAEANAGAPDTVLQNAQLAMDEAKTVRGKRVSTQVHRMLLKAKAAGDKKVRMDDRFFLEVHYRGNDTDVHHLFFSRLWTVGRTLDEILKTRRRYLRLEPEEEDCPLELARENSPSGLPAGRILNDLSPEQLQSFDVVEVRPRVNSPADPPSAPRIVDSPSPFPTATMRAGVEGCNLPVVPAVPNSDVDGAVAGCSPDGVAEIFPRELTACLGGEGEIRAERTSQAWNTGKASGAREERGADGTGLSGASKEVHSVNREDTAHTNDGAGQPGSVKGMEAREGMTITIGHGKIIHHLEGVIADQVTVLDIKRRLEPITGVPFLRQKLLYKGVLRDGDIISATKIREGAKVMLLGAAVGVKK